MQVVPAGGLYMRQARGTGRGYMSGLVLHAPQPVPGRADLFVRGSASTLPRPHAPLCRVSQLRIQLAHRILLQGAQQAHGLIYRFVIQYFEFFSSYFTFLYFLNEFLALLFFGLCANKLFVAKRCAFCCFMKYTLVIICDFIPEDVYHID